MEFETVKECLEMLLDLNNTENELQVDGKLGTINDLKDFNFELIVNMCDLLGLESLYLGIDTDESN
ncbi:hypothetical protein NQ504_05235 [Ligilactobacillus ruminis]|jgi:hypothetical protein|uniref:Uncharacterized protein n=1 Tax=Ligilactobacillus ruminis ATCC 25644 TaxID=525362 RepID=E7FPC2_9LACO|nr:hypothetical protein [Ligilactobacillus ruminis]DAH12780.1 MAG TPA: hypothetical protein [Caudoviricetes sp.]EFZ35164.1 hypothetical protein HMPREF0542_10749 [Ligilactobacillus ruminis ATCC 25644]MBD8998760.1 hypothetical protein [Ligilactobacillus ruminis]MSB43617.1 hypothetical protein [Ligilactobacillus ruminis]MSB54614.1 hypothetical protein [Ligilactobacillus ruminis]